MATRKTRRGPGLGRLSIVEIANELQSRRAELPDLRARHAELTAQLEEIETTIAAFGDAGSSNGHVSSRRGPGRPRGSSGKSVGKGEPGRRSGRTRPKNENNLVDSLTALLTGRTMSVTDIASEVQKAGYKTNSPNFRTIVNQALISSGKFKRSGRGLYIAK